MMNQHIDYTILKPGTTTAQVEQLCKTAIEKSYAAVCIPPHYIETVKSYFEPFENPPKICTVVGFPHGMDTTTVKTFEAQHYSMLGAQELDMVSNTALIKNGDWDAWLQDVDAFSQVGRAENVITKLIIETSLLTDNEIVKVCELAQNTDLDFIKTSTGFVGEGAKLEIVRQMRKLLPERYRIKASGGIRDTETAMKFIEAGADRIGTSAAL